jgi:capsular polysaccharide biosynthesis protein
MNDANATPSVPMPDEDEISLLDLATALGEEKATLFAIPFITTVVAVVVSLMMTPIFTAKTVVMPPQQQQSGAAAALASLGGLAGLAGAAGGIKSPDEMYVAFLGSEGMQNRIIAELKLQERYEAKTLTDTRAALKTQMRFASDKKSGLLSIEADDKDPAFAAELANRHVVELRAMLGRLAVDRGATAAPVLRTANPTNPRQAGVGRSGFPRCQRKVGHASHLCFGRNRGPGQR